jgi:uncharacterized Ntn-hydrolase superfamily protein
MTYSILARCARTGQIGVAVASERVAVGQYCDGAIRPGAGGSFTQGKPNPRNNRLAASLLAQSAPVGHVLRELVGSDPDASHRQIAVIDRDGEVMVHSGVGLRAFVAHRTGSGFAAIGESVAAEGVVAALAEAIVADPDAELEARLLAALEAGRDAGGLRDGTGSTPARSVALVVWGRRDYSDLDLRVDMHDGDAIAELRRIYVDYKPSAAYYEERARHPQNAIPAMEFADMLKRGVVGKPGEAK